MLFIWLLAVTCQVLGREIEIDLPGLGKVVGKNENSLNVFLGIPYAEPPVGNLRFLPPRVKRSWRPSVLSALKYSDDCLQSSYYNQESRAASEDCLYLNVFAPSNHAPDLLPVMVWIHGGAFSQGSANRLVYDGRKLSTMGVVIVSINYRLGAMGFLVSTSDGVHGNFGLQDQKLAFLWVKEHIRSLGGDPDRVTLFGESAGAMSVGIHLMDQILHPSCTKLFDAVILQSNPLGYKYRSLTVANFIGEDLKKQLNCETLDCLLTESADEILHVQDTIVSPPRSMGDFFTWGPVLTPVSPRDGPWELCCDMQVTVVQPMDALRLARLVDIPVLLGSNANEGDIFVHLAYPARMTRLVFHGILFSLFKLHMKAVLKAYAAQIKQFSVSLNQDYRLVLSRIIGDYLFRCPTMQFASILSSVGGPTYLYDFSFPTRVPEFPFCDGLACHSAELPFVFRNFELIESNYSWIEPKGGGVSSHKTSYGSILSVNRHPVETTHQRNHIDGRHLGIVMSTYWVAFSRTHNPNGWTETESSEERHTYSGPEAIPYWAPLLGGWHQQRQKMQHPHPLLARAEPVQHTPQSDSQVLHSMNFDKNIELSLIWSDCICSFWGELGYQF